MSRTWFSIILFVVNHDFEQVNEAFFWLKILGRLHFKLKGSDNFGDFILHDFGQIDKVLIDDKTFFALI